MLSVCRCGQRWGMVVDPNTSAQNLYALVSRASNSSDWRNLKAVSGNLIIRAFLILPTRMKNAPPIITMMSKISSDFSTSMLLLSSFVGEWIESIDISLMGAKYRFLPEDLFLSFNYTNVLEGFT